MDDKDRNEQLNSNPIDEQSEKIRYGAPDGPRNKHRAYHDSREPLEFPGHEAAAWFLAVPKELRNFKSITALAKHFNVTRMTVYRWTQDIDVLKRAESLSEFNKITAKLVIRRASVELAEKLVEMGMGGDITAIKECMHIALREDKQTEKSGLTSASIEEVLERAEIEYEKHSEMMTPTFLKERAKRLASGKPPVAAMSNVEPLKPDTEPAPDAAPVNSCDACGKTRCVHGRCPACELCAACEPPEQVQATV
jgi:hypothetical protein